MTDRELLELAAKAVGIIGKWVEGYGSGDYYYQGNAEGILHELPGGGWSVWNPLTDDGDALRLAAQLHLMINVTPIETHAYYQKGLADGVATDASYRRAIVRAAAAIAQQEQPQ